jgi:hypothetical protein
MDGGAEVRLGLQVFCHAMWAASAKLATAVVLGCTSTATEARWHRTSSISSDQRQSVRTASRLENPTTIESTTMVLLASVRYCTQEKRWKWMTTSSDHCWKRLRHTLSFAGGQRLLYFGTPTFHSSQWATTSLMNGAAAAHRLRMEGSKPPELPPGPQLHSESQAD